MASLESFTRGNWPRLVELAFAVDDSLPSNKETPLDQYRAESWGRLRAESLALLDCEASDSALPDD